MVRYEVDVAATHRHTFSVELRIDRPAAEQRLSLPAWIPGSYLVREFARHLSQLTAEQGGSALRLVQLDKASWAARCAPGVPLVVRYHVYAFDTSVRAAYLDASRGFFNGTSVCLRAEGCDAAPHALAIVGMPPGWEIATTLERPPGAAPNEFSAPDYDTLVDHPVELGRFWRARFDAAGVRHELVVAGALPDFDGERLVADTKRICETEIRFWHGDARAPFDRYLFLLNALEDGRGGLEHRSSTALVAARRDLPRLAAFDAAAKAGNGKSEPSDGYVGVLGLIAHEYFHAWNVKRLKPRDFARFDYGRENYTELLWFFEGFTSYYDDLLLVRSGLIDAPRYLKLLATTISGVQASPGRRVQSVAAASFDAWIKYYRSDENTPNATISYYAKGSLVALALDLTLRAGGSGSLDEVMRHLWRKSGGGPIDERDVAAALESVGGRSFAPELAEWVHGTAELPLAELLQRFAVDVEAQPATFAQRLGVRVSESALTGVKVTHVLRDGAAERAGIAAGDEVLAVGGWRVRRLDDALRALAPTGETPLLVGRDQRVLTLALAADALAGGDAGAVQLKPAEKADADARRRYEAWIAG